MSSCAGRRRINKSSGGDEWASGFSWGRTDPARLPTAAPSPALDSKRGNNPANHGPRRLAWIPRSSRRKRAIGCALLPHFRVWHGRVRLATLAASPLSDSVPGQCLSGVVSASGRYTGENYCEDFLFWMASASRVTARAGPLVQVDQTRTVDTLISTD